MFVCEYFIFHSYHSFYSLHCLTKTSTVSSTMRTAHHITYITTQDKRQRLETFEHRLNMCRAAFGDMPRVTVSDAEYKSWLAAVQDVPVEKRDQVSVGTAALIEYLNKNNIGNNKKQDDGDNDEEVEEVYSFVMGADTFLDLTAGKWKESARVLDLLQGRLVVLEREQLTANSTASSTSTGGDDNAAANVALKKAVEAVPGARLLKVDNLNHISSSQVRACPSVAEIQKQNMVVPAVLEYMRQHGLYGVLGGDNTD
jgi:nicotinic acid mononucleotide adenylyltransferase